MPTMPRLPEILTMTAAGLTALGNAPLWIALAIAFPPALTATVHSVNALLAGVSDFRAASMRRRHTDRLLSEITDCHAALGHLERVQTSAPPPAAPPPTDPPPPSPTTTDPPPATPP